MTTETTDRLFYADPYQTHFEAHVVERLTWKEHPAVVLDRTAFYPNAGGQPADHGTLGDVAVIGAEVRPEDGAVIHLLAEPLEADDVVGQIDWERRFDHMQQHTGQHLLSAACEQLLEAETVSFHLGSETSTIDLDRVRVTPEEIEPVESLVNRIIWEDRPVRPQVIDSMDLAGLDVCPPPGVEGPIRLVEVVDFDLNPCGGTHVTRTGEIGLLKVLRLDYRGDETRVEFVCGGRALEDYRDKNFIVMELGAALTVGYWELPEAVARLQEGLKEAEKRLRGARKELLAEVGGRLARMASPVGDIQVVSQVLDDQPPGDLRVLAYEVTSHADTLALLASLHEGRVHVCFARSDGVDRDAAALLHTALDELDGKGGGNPTIAQGSAPLVDRERVEAVLNALVDTLYEQ